jgi:hypothetical protein
MAKTSTHCTVPQRVDGNSLNPPDTNSAEYTRVYLMVNVIISAMVSADGRKLSEKNG